jgi:hypothetical protein
MRSPSAPAPISLSTRFFLLIKGLCEAICSRLAADQSDAVIIFLAWERLRRLSDRFESLVSGFCNEGGWGGGSFGSWADPPTVRLPTKFGWFLQLVPEAAAYAGPVQEFLGDPRLPALLAEGPRAARILRPLCRMLGLPLPPELAPPPRPKRPKPAKADAAPAHSAAAAAGPPEHPNPALLNLKPKRGSELWPPDLSKREPPRRALIRQTDPPGAYPPLNVPWGPEPD